MTYEISKYLDWDQKHNPNPFSVKWTFNLLNGGMNKGVSLYEVYELFNKIGCALNIDFPYGDDYTSWPTNKIVYERALNYKINNLEKNNGLVYYENSDDLIGSIKYQLYYKHPIVFSTKYVYGWHFLHSKDNPNSKLDDYEVGVSVCSYVNTSFGVNRHALTIVGYNDDIWIDINNNNKIDDGELGAFKIVNSWGEKLLFPKENSPDFSENINDLIINGKTVKASIISKNGFMWLSYDAIKKESNLISSIDRVSAFSELDNGNYCIGLLSSVNTNYKPDAKLELTLSTNNRSKLAIYVNNSYLPIFNPNAIIGNTISLSKANMIFDISDLFDYNNYELTIENLDGSSNVSLDKAVIYQGDKNIVNNFYAIASEDQIPTKIYSSKSFIFNVPTYKYSIGVLNFSSEVTKYAIFGTSIAYINDRAKIYDANNNGYGNVFCGGKDNLHQSLRIGSNAEVGNVYSNIDVFNRGGIIHGDLNCNNYESQDGSLVEGNINLTTNVHPSLFINNKEVDDFFRGKFLDNSTTFIENGQELILNPGNSRSNIVIRDGGKLILKGKGDYYFKSLIAEPGAVINCGENRVNIFVNNIFNLKDRAKLQGNPAKVLIESFSHYTTIIGTSSEFNGTLVAPYSYISIYSGENGIINGAFLGSEVELHQGSMINFIPYDYSNSLNNTELNSDVEIIASPNPLQVNTGYNLTLKTQLKTNKYVNRTFYYHIVGADGVSFDLRDFYISSNSMSYNYYLSGSSLVNFAGQFLNIFLVVKLPYENKVIEHTSVYIK